MRKFSFLIICSILILLCFSCGSPTSKKPVATTPISIPTTPDDPPKNDATTVTAAELIKKLPITFKDFQNQTTSPSREASTISWEDCPPVISWDYSRVSDEESNAAVVLFVSILKNDIGPSSIDIPLGQTVDVSSIKTYSQDTVTLFSTVEIDPADWITNLGRVKVTYDAETDNMEIFWLVTTKNFLDEETTSSPLYITGIYKDGKYQSVTSQIYSDGHPLIESFIKTENGFVDNGISMGEESPYKRKTIMENDAKKDFFYQNGKATQIGYLDSSLACYWRTYRDSPSEEFYVFDENGYLVFTESGSSNNYMQIIPLNFLQSSITIVQEGQYFYQGSVSEENKLINLENRQFDVYNSDKSDSEYKDFVCLKLSSTANNTIDIPTYFTFQKKDYTISAINKIAELLEESKTTAIKDDFLTDAELQEIQTTIDTWIQSL